MATKSAVVGLQLVHFISFGTTDFENPIPSAGE